VADEQRPFDWGQALEKVTTLLGSISVRAIQSDTQGFIAAIDVLNAKVDALKRMAQSQVGDTGQE